MPSGRPSLLSAFDSLSLLETNGTPPHTPSMQWRFWHFECSAADLPTNCSQSEKSIQNMMLSGINNPQLEEEGKPHQQQFLSSERWLTYLEPSRSTFDNNSSRLPEEVIKSWRPSMLAREICLNKKLGIALFRDGIVPDYSHETCHGGGYFSIFLFTTTGDSIQLVQYNRIFDSFVLLALHQLPEHLLEEVSGIFMRARTDIGSLTDDVQNIDNNNNTNKMLEKEDLPCKFIFELWIRDRARAKEFWPVLNTWCAEQKERHGMAPEATFKLNSSKY